ncbi:hypothetical protein Pst134EA_019025 [Puccinia striiformis f. sp. tritici]|uniref:hypothetical protein n=1 Tax=Puccinia striiformis f. sp. tritici TaxID=168172 RepID=UPI0020082D24|nr:hypothetical protein Pst134EA_019025 [Puccinia striiformis f. sp. tritici]KAH9458871.1 hypothetical protein Pst134EA_019025 [Puccinia striiformis f. sp. tritici]
MLACGGCHPGKLLAQALDLDKIKAALPVRDKAETVGTETIKTLPAMKNNRQTTLTFKHKEEASETKPTVKETSNIKPTPPEQLYQISVLDIMADFFM